MKRYSVIRRLTAGILVTTLCGVIIVQHHTNIYLKDTMVDQRNTFALESTVVHDLFSNETPRDAWDKASMKFSERILAKPNFLNLYVLSSSHQIRKVMDDGFAEIDSDWRRNILDKDMAMLRLISRQYSLGIVDERFNNQVLRYLSERQYSSDYLEIMTHSEQGLVDSVRTAAINSQFSPFIVKANYMLEKITDRRMSLTYLVNN